MTRTYGRSPPPSIRKLLEVQQQPNGLLSYTEVPHRPSIHRDWEGARTLDSHVASSAAANSPLEMTS